MTTRTQSEAGFVLVLTGLLMTVLLGLAGFAVDLGNWYHTVSRLQNAVDAASLAGAVYLPDYPDSAYTAAHDTLLVNNIPEGSISVSVIAPNPDKPAYMHVESTLTATNYFSRLLGLSESQTFRRSAEATWRPELGVGKWSNVLGSEPTADKWEPADKQTGHNAYWLTINGGLTPKVDGERFSSRYCQDPTYKSDPTGCKDDANLEYEDGDDGVHTKGRDFIAEAPAGLMGDSIAIEVFDPAYVIVWDGCGESDLTDLYAKTKDPAHIPGPGPLCSSDGSYREDTARVVTDFEVFDSKGKAVPACPGNQVFQPYGDQEGDKPGLDSYSSDPNFLAVFRKWVRLCNAPYDPINGSKHVIRVRTGRDQDGTNNFKMRAGLTSGGTLASASTQRQIHLYAKGSITTFVWDTAAHIRRPASVVPMGYAGTDISVSLFDLGDAEKPSTVALTSESMSPSSSSGTSTESCEIRGPLTTTWKPLPNCTIYNVHDGAGYDGRAVDIIWHVPSDYDCDLSGATPGKSCSLSVDNIYAASGTVNDQTTISATAVGAPLRLTS